MPTKKSPVAKIPSQLNWQLRVPPELPGILKEYTKAILREQPFDVLEFSAKYFQEMSEAARNRTAESRLTTGHTVKQGKTLDFLLLDQLKNKLEITRDTGDISIEKIEEAWAELGLANVQLKQIISVGDLYHGQIPALKFMALCAAAVSTQLNESMCALCALLDGLPILTFDDCYRFLAKIDGDIPKSVVNRAMKFVGEKALEAEDHLVTVKIFEESTCPRFQ